MPAPLFLNKSDKCPYGHSLAPGMLQKVSWLPCMCGPAREAGRQGRDLGHMTVVRDVQRRGPPGHDVLRAAAPGQLQPSAQRLGNATGRLKASLRHGEILRAAGLAVGLRPGASRATRHDHHEPP
jgi:hypothetical protein